MRKLGCCVLTAPVLLFVGAGVALGDDQENAGVGVLVEDLPPVDDVLPGAASSQLGALPLPDCDELTPLRPLTRASKSSAVAPFGEESNGEPEPPKDMKSSLAAVVVEVLPDSSWSFRVCSSSTLLERERISSMNAWNCLSSSRGPRLIDQRMGRISMATKSASATSPTIRRTRRPATITAGSLVLITRISGTIFSCMVYLSNALEEDVFLLELKPLSPSSPPPSLEPPQSTTNACRPRTLIAKLFVLLNTLATTGKSSFLMVLKSRIGRMAGILLNAASTIECVGHSIAAMIIGNISANKLAKAFKSDTKSNVAYHL